jgi:hypothetical protein
MKHKKILFPILLLLIQQFVIAQTGQWKLAGNNLAGTEKLGSTNNTPLNFITGNQTRMSLTSLGNLNISSDQSSIQFALPGANPKPMMFMFPSGTVNKNRMVIAHSPSNPNFGLQYDDNADKFDFLSAGVSVFNVNLGISSVGVNGTFNVSGNSIFTGNIITGSRIGIGTSTPTAELHIVRGSAGVAPFFGAPLVVENSINSYMNLLAPNNFETGILFGNPTSNIDGGIVYNNGVTPKGFQFRTSSNFTRMVLTSNGSVGLGTTSPLSELHIVHASIEDGNHGLKIQNTGGHTWTLCSSAGFFHELLLFSDNSFRGFFDGPSGEYTSVSDAKRKKDIEKAPDVLEKVMQLDVKKYHFVANKPEDKKHYGMIAQETEKIFPEVVYHKKMDGNNELYTMNYSAFGVIAIKAIQEQQKKIEEQEQTNQQQQQKIISLEERITKLEAAISNNSLNSTSNSSMIKKEISGPSLEQNQPNPFNQNTLIRYHLPQGASGEINLYDANGTLVKTLKANESGQAIINSSDLKTGTYLYTLIANKKTVGSKKLVVLK